MTQTEQHVNHHLAAIQHEQAAKALQTIAANRAARADYVGAYEAMGKAAAEWAAANQRRKLAQGYQGVSA